MDYKDLVALETERVKRQAEALLNTEPLTITSFPCSRSCGTLHDYYSEADYWWPNAKKRFAPYIRRDGESNPNIFIEHRDVLKKFSTTVSTLIAAFTIDSNDAYVNTALSHLNAWFVDEETKLAPSIFYSQAVTGRTSGSQYGIIDWVHLVEVALSVKKLHESRPQLKASLTPVMVWFEQYLDWLLSDEYGIKAMLNGNNHSTAWTLQVAVYAHLLGDREKINLCFAMLYEKLVGQINQIGGFLMELKRTRPYNYSIFNLDVMVGLLQVLSHYDDKVWHHKVNGQVVFRQAVEFLYPYLIAPESWPYGRDIEHFDDLPVRNAFLLFSGLAYAEQKYTDLWQSLSPFSDNKEVMRNMAIRQPLLWL